MCSVNLAQILVSNGADLTARTRDGQLAVDIARAHNNVIVYEFLTNVVLKDTRLNRNESIIYTLFKNFCSELIINLELIIFTFMYLLPTNIILRIFFSNEKKLIKFFNDNHTRIN